MSRAAQRPLSRCLRHLGSFFLLTSSLLVAAVVVVIDARPVRAGQAPVDSSRQGQLVVTARDTLEGRLPGATVTVTGVGGDATGEPRLVVTDATGEASLSLGPGEYQVAVEMPGFETVSIDVTIDGGETERPVVTLGLSRFSEQVAVTTEDLAAAPSTDGFAETLSAEEIDQLPDDPEELALMLESLAGSAADVRVNGFPGGELPPKAQIQAVRIRRDPFSPDSMGAGQPRVEIITRPGTNAWRHEVAVGLRDQAVDARQAFAPRRGEGQTRRVSWNFSGPLVRERTSVAGRVSLSDAFEAQTIVASTNAGDFNGIVNRERGRVEAELRVEHAVSATQTMRAEYQRRNFTGDNLGVGDFDLPERAFAEDTTRDTARLSHMATFGKKALNEARIAFVESRQSTDSLSDAVIVDVQNAFTAGGAQRQGGRRDREVDFADTLELFGSPRHKLRLGFEGELGWSRSDRLDNGAGTFTFASLADYEAGRPRQFVQRIGNPLVTYARQEISWFAHDEITLTKRVRLGVGLRHDFQSLLDDPWNVAPRLSATWTPSERGRTTFTVGVGAFNNWYPASVYEQTLLLDGQRQRDLIVREPGFPDPFGRGADAELPPPSVVRADQELSMETSTRTSLGVEHRLTRRVRIQASVFHQVTRDRLRSLNVNAPLGGMIPDPAFGRITQVRSISEARSKGFETSVRASTEKNGASGVVRYRYARAFNDADGALSLPADGSDLDAEWGPSSGDVRHRVFGFVRLQLPLGVRANLTGDVNSGAPYTIRTGFDDNGDTVFLDRPAGVGRNGARGTWQRVVDLRLGWRPTFGAASVAGQGGPAPGGRGRRGANAKGVEIYAQVTNLFNETNFTRFSGVLTSPFFGRPVAAGPPRRFDFGTRVFF